MENLPEVEKEKTDNFVEGEDFYFENSFMVLTKYFLEKRGYCCHNNCRNCPYQKEQDEKS